MDVNIVSDWESKFTSTFQRAFSEGTWYKDHMGTSYHPLTYCQLERTTQNLKDMFRDCVGWNFGKHLPIPEFAYIDNYLLSIEKKIII